MEISINSNGEYDIITNNSRTDRNPVKKGRRKSKDIIDTNVSSVEALYSLCFAIFGQIVTDKAGHVVSDIYRFPTNVHDAINAFRGQETLDDTNSYLVKAITKDGKLCFEDATNKDIISATKKTVSRIQTVRTRADNSKQIELETLLSANM